MHICPKRTGKIPHVGGPIVAGSPNVIIGGMPAARVGDMAVCVGPPDKISSGSSTVLINGKPAARMGDSTAHGGKIVTGCPTVLIGDSGGGGSSASAAPQAQADSAQANTEEDTGEYAQALALTSATKSGKGFCEIC
jgi:uncharacterized Zn-binding protein involved in type VI secretion